MQHLPPTCVLIANTAPATALGLKCFLQADPKQKKTEVLSPVYTTAALLEAVANKPVDLILLDTVLFLQPEFGWHLQSKTQGTPILLHGPEQVKLPDLPLLLEYNVRGFIPLQATAQEYNHAIQHVLAGGLLFSGGIHSQNDGKSSNSYHARLQALWKQEQRVLKLLASGWKKERIACRLGIGLKTVQKYQTHILKKLEVKNAFELLQRDFINALEAWRDHVDLGVDHTVTNDDMH